MASRGFEVSVTGAKSYVAANQLRSGGRKRTERCIAKVQHLYRDVDTDCDTRLTSLRASEALLTPTPVISTSPGKYQVRWRIDCSPIERQESTLKLFCIAFGRDPVCTNFSWIPRPPGYPSCKYDTTHSVTCEYLSDSTSNPDAFRLDIAAANAILLPAQFHGKSTPKSTPIPTTIGSGFGMNSPTEKTSRNSANAGFASRRFTRFSFTSYRGQSMSQSTKLWLIGDIPMDDVVTVLEVRRRFEIPVALCSARPRKIALAMQRLLLGDRF